MIYLKKIYLIDDDPINNKISEVLIKKLCNHCRITTFLNVREALTFLEKNLLNIELLPEVILLDLRFPEIQEENGWDFLQKYQNLLNQMLHPAHLYILTSSISNLDEESVKVYSFIKRFFKQNT